jgi:hypothetical protein
MLFLFLQKDGRKGCAGIQLRLTLHQIRTLTYLFLSLTIRRKMKYMTLIVCLHWSLFWRPQWRRLDAMCEMFQMGAHTLCWYGGRVCL